jgi:hypothetical protein
VLFGNGSPLGQDSRVLLGCNEQSVVSLLPYVLILLTSLAAPRH